MKREELHLSVTISGTVRVIEYIDVDIKSCSRLKVSIDESDPLYDASDASLYLLESIEPGLLNTRYFS